MTQSSPQEERPLDPARALDEAIARRERELEELARDFDRIEEELEGGEADAEIARLIDLHAAEIARPRRGFPSSTGATAGEGLVAAEVGHRLDRVEAVQAELRSRLEAIRVGQENLDRKVEGGFAALIEAQRRAGGAKGVREGGLAAFRSARHRLRLALYLGMLFALLVTWRWLALAAG